MRTLQEIRREYGRPLLVPMTLVDPQYLDEIFGSLHMAGEDVRHFFLSLEVVGESPAICHNVAYRIVAVGSVLAHPDTRCSGTVSSRSAQPRPAPGADHRCDIAPIGRERRPVGAARHGRNQQGPIIRRWIAETRRSCSSAQRW